jgi:hypothetical protein
LEESLDLVGADAQRRTRSVRAQADGGQAAFGDMAPDRVRVQVQAGGDIADGE